MQDEYVKTFEKIQLDDDRKLEMRKALEKEMALTRVPAKKTRLGAGAKACIAVAAIALTIGGLMAFPTTRNVIAASIRNIVKLVVPEGAVDAVEQEKINREERVIPTDEVPESVAEEIKAIVSEQDREQDEYFESVIVDADYYSDPELNELASYYASQGYSILDLKKDSMYFDYEQDFNTEDWFSEGFFITFQVGDNATAKSGNILAFKATEDQVHGFLQNKLALINYERNAHGQSTVTFDELWVKIEDEDGNIVYTGSWVGPEPEIKLLPSDSARTMDIKITYDTETQIAVCYIEDGGGVG